MRTASRGRLVALLLLAALLGLTGSCGEGSPEGDGGGAAATTHATVQGADVTLTGQVARIFGAHVIQVGDGPAEPVLVVLRAPNSFPVGTRLEVSGRIRTFNSARLAAELGVDLGPEAPRFDGERCLVAVVVRSV